MVKFSPTALNFGYDFVLLVHFFWGHPVDSSESTSKSSLNTSILVLCRNELTRCQQCLPTSAGDQLKYRMFTKVTQSVLYARVLTGLKVTREY